MVRHYSDYRGSVEKEWEEACRSAKGSAGSGDTGNTLGDRRRLHRHQRRRSLDSVNYLLPLHHQ